ncbi:hypothetical protein Bca4012_013746 [Brassica carinata]
MESSRHCQLSKAHQSTDRSDLFFFLPHLKPGKLLKTFNFSISRTIGKKKEENQNLLKGLYYEFPHHIMFMNYGESLRNYGLRYYW